MICTAQVAFKLISEDEMTTEIEKQKELAADPNITPEEQLHLAKNGSLRVKEKLASNPKITPEVQMILAKDEDKVVTSSLSLNPSLVKEAQLHLHIHKDIAITNSLGLNPNLIPEIQDYIIRGKNNTDNDGNYLLFCNLAKNPNLTPENQKKLFEIDRSDAFIDFCDLNEDKIDKFTYPDKIKLLLAGNPSIIPELQIKLCSCKPASRVCLAQNLNITPQAQEILVKDEDKVVKHYLAKNPNVLPEIKKILEETN